jgi:hypothetical protein
LKSKYFILICLLQIVFGLRSQNVSVHAALDSSKIRIGEQVMLDLYLTYDGNQKGFSIDWPSIGDTITGKVEVISVSPIDTTIPNQNNPSIIQHHQRIIISAYDSGYFAIPGFKFVINSTPANTLFTQPLLLEVHTVPTDTSITKIKDIKTIFSEPFSWKWFVNYVYWALGLLLFTALIVFITRYYLLKKRQKIVVPEKPKVPAHIAALESLEKIRNEQVWKEGRVKEYYSSITDTIRLYIEERFGVFALESTTDEIMAAFRTQVVDPESKNKLQQLLQLADLVKFAKMAPIEMEHQFTLQNAFDFVNGTKREEVITLPEDTNQENKQAKN